MSDKFRRVIAWIAVGFAVIFSLSFILYLIDQHMLNDVIGVLTVVSGGITLSLFLIIKLDNRNRKIDEMQKKQEEERVNATPQRHANKNKKQENKDE